MISEEHKFSRFEMGSCRRTKLRTQVTGYRLQVWNAAEPGNPRISNSKDIPPRHIRIVGDTDAFDAIRAIKNRPMELWIGQEMPSPDGPESSARTLNMLLRRAGLFREDPSSFDSIVCDNKRRKRERRKRRNRSTLPATNKQPSRYQSEGRVMTITNLCTNQPEPSSCESK
ncbi:uncharacterized protein PADG_12358 [Paracoccidioides brasiliensis Pb18]|uniref:Uncharacterized protein n=1 Tax=Paracoccidioides brasiliensis (strain Pb18) TaxID=502780 RepID=A0A0A0HTE1_PARBD|nr:uncharacterized protein PADG_12358 [Paracoccidioides brasiliensis Pb18]KGM91583.1 hypothetical protein PADG_12358 [Paracoccidioides brasiliensis Pb18]